MAKLIYFTLISLDGYIAHPIVTRVLDLNYRDPWVENLPFLLLLLFWLIYVLATAGPGRLHSRRPIAGVSP